VLQGVLIFLAWAGFLVFATSVLFASPAGLIATIATALVIRGVLVARSLQLRKTDGQVRSRRSWARWALLLAALVVGSLALRVGIPQIQRYRGFVVNSQANTPTVRVGERVMVDTRASRSMSCSPGELIVYTPPTYSPESPGPQFVIKRCVATEGDTVEFRDFRLYVNGVQVEAYPPPLDSSTREAAVGRGLRPDIGPVVVPEGSFYAVGENLSNSLDSRQYGPVDGDALYGSVAYVYWSFDRSRVGLRLGK
jgi:signal peptidase I